MNYFIKTGIMFIARVSTKNITTATLVILMSLASFVLPSFLP